MDKVFVISLFTLLISSTSHSQVHKIAVVDTGLDVEDVRFKRLICGYRDYTGEGIEDKSGHGTHVAGLIKKYANNSKNYCLLILKYYSPKNNGLINARNLISSFREAVDQKATIVNFSGGGPEFVQEEYDIIKNNPQVKFVVAAGNESMNLDNPNNQFYPASYNLPNIISVGNLEDEHTISKSSNYGFLVKVWEIGTNLLSTVPCKSLFNVCEAEMTGTSMAAGVVTGKMIRKLKK